MGKRSPKKLPTQFSFRAKLWKYDGPAGWCFVTLPRTTAKRIRTLYQSSEEGWGRLKTTATIGQTSWQTAIWFDTKAGSYLLPIKATVRNKEYLAIGPSVSVTLSFVLERWMLSQD